VGFCEGIIGGILGGSSLCGLVVLGLTAAVERDGTKSLLIGPGMVSRSHLRSFDRGGKDPGFDTGGAVHARTPSPLRGVYRSWSVRGPSDDGES